MTINPSQNTPSTPPNQGPQQTDQPPALERRPMRRAAIVIRRSERLNLQNLLMPDLDARDLREPPVNRRLDFRPVMHFEQMVLDQIAEQAENLPTHAPAA